MQDGADKEFSNGKLAKYGFWVLVVLLCLLGLYLVKGALFSFVIGLVLTYVLHPFVKLFEKWNPLSDTNPSLARGIAIFLVFIIVLMVTAGYLLVVVPPLFKQTTELLNSLPTFIQEHELLWRVGIKNTLQPSLKKFGSKLTRCLKMLEVFWWEHLLVY